jgi:Tfp pilus assembly protein PilV
MRAHGRSGFTILEVLVAMGILLFGMTTILGLLTYGTALSRSAQLRASAASAAQATIADLEETFFPLKDGELAEPVAIEGRAVPGAEGLVYSAKGTANPERPTEYRVDVAMTWSSQGQKREKRFTTLLYKELQFGERLRRRATPGAEKPPPSSKPGTPPAGNPAPGKER